MKCVIQDRSVIPTELSQTLSIPIAQSLSAVENNASPTNTVDNISSTNAIENTSSANTIESTNSANTTVDGSPMTAEMTSRIEGSFPLNCHRLFPVQLHKV